MRFIVLHWEGLSEAILDLQTSQLFEVPYTLFYSGPVATSLSWMRDDRLFLVRTEGEPHEFVNFAEIWRISPDQGELVLEQSVTVPTGPSAHVTEATQLENGSLAIAAASFKDGDVTAGIYVLDPQQGVQHLNNRFPFRATHTDDLVWIPNGDGALVIWYLEQQSSQTGVPQYDFMYLELDNPLLYHIRPLFGDSIPGDRGPMVSWRDG